jgi:N-acetylglutamate synthase-like GNAT family acetyltransferase
MVNIRKAEKKDIPTILDLYKQLSFEPDKYQKAPEPDGRCILHEIEKYPNASLLVAEEEGKVVGTTFLAILPTFAHGTSPFGVIEYVVVDEKCRSKGIGKALMDECKARAKAAGCYKVMLASSKQRTRAHKFYRAQGFKEDALSFRFYF